MFAVSFGSGSVEDGLRRAEYQVTKQRDKEVSRGESGSPRHGVVSDTHGFLIMVAESDTLQSWNLITLFFLPLTGSVR
jgi:hypothetical protein